VEAIRRLVENALREVRKSREQHDRMDDWDAEVVSLDEAQSDNARA
jgi:hypothetical protein